ncbi:Protein DETOXIFICATION 33 [Bienertia sinuspersici]
MDRYWSHCPASNTNVHLHVSNTQAPPSRRLNFRCCRKICILGDSSTFCICLKFFLFRSFSNLRAKVLVMKSSLGLFGAAMAGNISWFILVLGQLIYIMSGSFLDAWTGFSVLAFKSLKDFVKLSLASAIILVVKKLISESDSNCSMNLDVWTLMIALGFNAAISFDVCNNRDDFSSHDHRVAAGAGWQSLFALINIGCYYLVGLPISALLGYKLDLGVHGIWVGLLLGVLLQTATLLLIVFIKQRNE